MRVGPGRRGFAWSTSSTKGGRDLSPVDYTNFGQMGVGNKAEQRLLLSYCSFTCIYLPVILTLKFNDNLYNVGKYKFLPVLMILTFAEVTKVLLFPMLQAEAPTIIKIEQRASPRSRRSWAKSLREVFKFALTALALSIVYYVMIVLFGAPVLTDHEETTMLVVTLTTLTFVSTSLHLGVDGALDILLGTYSQKGNILADALKLNIQATILGTWLGATVIPLDWDRPWQAWPIPCVIGALLGYLIAHFITLIKTLPAPKLRRKVIYSLNTQHLGVDGSLDILMETCSQTGNILANALKLNIQAMILGTWLDATVIPLDWDRPWQAWPIPCVIGTLLGYSIAYFVTLIKTLPEVT